MFVMFCRYSILWKWLVHILSVVDQLKLKPVGCWRKENTQFACEKTEVCFRSQRARICEVSPSGHQSACCSAQNHQISLSKRTLRRLDHVWSDDWSLQVQWAFQEPCLNRRAWCPLSEEECWSTIISNTPEEFVKKARAQDVIWKTLSCADLSKSNSNGYYWQNFRHHILGATEDQQKRELVASVHVLHVFWFFLFI